MKKLILLLAMVSIGQMVVAQSCTCTTAQQLRPSGYYGNYDFNCYQYVRATFAGNHYGQWIPPYYNTIKTSFSANVISENNDPNDFEEVCDPVDANVVVYPCGHAAVLLNQQCLVEKVGYGSELRRYGLNYGSCNISSSTKYFKYIGGGWPYRGINIGSCGYSVDCGGGGAQICQKQAVWYNTNNVLNTVNWTSNYFNKIWAKCDQATSFTWTKVSGNDVYNNCFSSCQGLYFYLNAGQSATYQVKAKDGGTTLWTKNYTFVRSGGSWLVDNDKITPQEFEQQGNNLLNNSSANWDVEIYTVAGQPMQTFMLGAYDSRSVEALTSGIYLVVIKSEGELLETRKLFFGN